MKAKIAVVALLMLSSTAASAVERIDFTGTANRGARTTAIVNNQSTIINSSNNDNVSGFISFDLSAPGVALYESVSPYENVYFYSSPNPGFINYAFTSSGVNPSPSGALMGGYVQFTSYSPGIYEFRVQAYNAKSVPRTYDQNGNILTGGSLDNSLQVILSGYADLVRDAGGNPVVKFSRITETSFFANDADVFTDYRSNPNGVTNGTQMSSSGTFGQFNSTLIAAVPEPATWAMMLVGFGIIGAASRYRGRGTPAATTEG